MSEQIDNSDMNNDIQINDKMQLTLPAIQLKYAGRVFRALLSSSIVIALAKTMVLLLSSTLSSVK